MLSPSRNAAVGRHSCVVKGSAQSINTPEAPQQQKSASHNKNNDKDPQQLLRSSQSQQTVVSQAQEQHKSASHSNKRSSNNHSELLSSLSKRRPKSSYQTDEDHSLHDTDTVSECSTVKMSNIDEHLPQLKQLAAEIHKEVSYKKLLTFVAKAMWNQEMTFQEIQSRMGIDQSSAQLESLFDKIRDKKYKDHIETFHEHLTEEAFNERASLEPAAMETTETLTQTSKPKEVIMAGSQNSSQNSKGDSLSEVSSTSSPKKPPAQLLPGQVFGAESPMGGPLANEDSSNSHTLTENQVASVGGDYSFGNSCLAPVVGEDENPAAAQLQPYLHGFLPAPSSDESNDGDSHE